MSTTVDKDRIHQIINLMGETARMMTDRDIENLMSWCQGLFCKIQWQHEHEQQQEHEERR